MEIQSLVQRGIVTKMRVALHDDFTTEVVLIERPEKNIVCFSTQVGCPVKCTFCASGGPDRFKRNLSYYEMIALCGFAHGKAREPSKRWVFSAMGEGEPAFNPMAVTSALRTALDNTPGAKAAVSTSAPSEISLLRLINCIKQVAIPIKIQYSLHAADPHLRRRMIPVGDLKAHEALEILATSGCEVELNVVLIDGLNDTEQHLLDLISTLRHIHVKWYVKLNRYNRVDGIDLRPADEYAYKAFEQGLRKAGYDVEYYETDGSDMSAACGQLHYGLQPKAISPK